MRTRSTAAATVQGFTLVELLVVISIVALLIGILLPTLSAARRSARVMACLSNVRQMQTAHWLYMADYDGHFIDIGLGHGASTYSEDAAWINTLSEYYGTPLIARSPLDDSPHWGPAPAGEPIPGGPPDRRRRTSYGVNNFLTPISPTKPYLTLDQIPQPTSVNQFLIMAFTGSFAGADHPHVENWFNPFLPGIAPKLAEKHVQIDAAGGPHGSPRSLSNWGFLDGHALTAEFSHVYQSPTHNRMDPAVGY